MRILCTEDERDACRPPERISVSEWADKYRVLTPRISAKPGPWRTAYTPYLRGIMDAWTAPGVEEIVLCKGAQAGASEAAFNCLGYSIAQDPGSALCVYSNEDVAKWTSENRLQDMVSSSPALREVYRERESDMLELQFRGMYVVLTGANSPAALASRPVRYIIFDEVDKYPLFTGREASPLKLGKERTKTFANRKIMYISTPTLDSGNIWKLLESCDAVYRYFVPCPHCGKSFNFELGGIVWPKELTEALRNTDEPELRRKLLRSVEAAAVYKCPECGGEIEDKNKHAMLLKGEWQLSGDAPLAPKRVGFHWNSIYSPQVSFGQVAAEFLKSKDSPEALMNFINSWLAEPFRETAAKAEPEKVLESCGSYERGTVTAGAVALTFGADVQKDQVYYVVRAWGPSLTSWLVEYGHFDSWNGDDLQGGLLHHIVDPVFRFADGRVCQISFGLTDCGYRTDEVYDACTVYSDVMMPVKGSSRQLDGYYVRHAVDKREREGLICIEANTSLLKDFLFGRMAKEPGSRGSWSLFRGTGRDYAEQIASEHKVLVTDPKTKVVHREWQLIRSHAQNHWLDCEVYAALAARMLNLQYLPTEEERAAVRGSSAPAAKDKEESSWLGGRSGWLG